MSSQASGMISPNALNGTTTSNVRPTTGPKNPGGVTPTMVKSVRLMGNDRPTTSRAPPNSRCQNAYEITVTGSEPRVSSASMSVRPSTAGTPSVSKNDPLAHSPSTQCVSPPADRSNCEGPHAATPSKRPASRCSHCQAGKPRPMPPTTARRPGSRTGSGRSMTLLMSEKMAVLAPMPSANVSTATSVNPGLRESRRTP